MARNKGIVLALAGFGEAGDTPELAQRRKKFLPSRKSFMHIALMSYIKNETVIARIEHAVEGNRQFNNTKVGGQMPARMRNLLNEKRPQLFTKGIQLFFVKAFATFA